MMRRWLGFALVALSLVSVATSCAPAVNLIAPQCPKGYDCQRLETGWSVIADAQKPGFVIGAAADITGYSSIAPCQLRKIAGGDKRSLECNAPNRVTLDVRGQIQVLLLETAPVKASP
jgi:hypothetical protein